MKRLLALLILVTPALALAAETHGEAASGGHAAAAPPTPFAGTIAQSVAALLVFFIVFFVLKTKAWGPILKGLTDREDKIRADLHSAEAARTEAQAALANYKKQIADADAQVREKLAIAQKDAEQIGVRLKADAQREIEEMKNRAARELDEAKRAALAEVHAHAAQLSTAVAGKILKRQINEADQADLIRSSLEELQVAGRR
jgi:F-type H+-transporting ATPase subunit b